jgi:drug/metabolite transporter (DMT)-like permease
MYVTIPVNSCGLCVVAPGPVAAGGEGHMLSYLLAVLAAFGNATSSVLQRKANREVPSNQNLSWRLIWSLLHQPVWFGGVLTICIGFLLQATALGFGQLATVEPILVLELPLTLILASRIFGQGMRWREWGSAVVMTVSLGALLFLLSPSAGRNGHVRWYGWVFGISVNLALVGALVLVGRRKSARGSGSAYRAVLLGIAAGSTFGLTAALMKGMTRTFSQGIVTLFANWEIYAMVAAGLLALRRAAPPHSAAPRRPLLPIPSARLTSHPCLV